MECKDGKTRLSWGEVKTRDFRRLYATTKNEDLAVLFDCSQRTVARRAREMGLEKDTEWMREMNRKHLEMMHAVNKICGVKYDREKLLEVGKPYRFKKREEDLGSTM